MSTIIVCNICRSENTTKILTLSERYTKGLTGCSTIDLCDDCYKKFLEFLKGE